MKLLGSTKKDVDQAKDEEDVPKLKSVKVVLMPAIWSIIFIRKHPKYYLLLYLIKNLVS